MEAEIARLTLQLSKCTCGNTSGNRFITIVKWYHKFIGCLPSRPLFPKLNSNSTLLSLSEKDSTESLSANKLNPAKTKPRRNHQNQKRVAPK